MKKKSQWYLKDNVRITKTKKLNIIYSNEIIHKYRVKLIDNVTIPVIITMVLKR